MKTNVDFLEHIERKRKRIRKKELSRLDEGVALQDSLLFQKIPAPRKSRMKKEPNMKKLKRWM